MIYSKELAGVADGFKDRRFKMTVQELYDYAKDNNILDADIYVKDEYGSYHSAWDIEVKNMGVYTNIELS